MKKYIYYGIGLGAAFLAGYILAAYYARKIQDDAHDAAIDTVLRSSDQIAELKNEVADLKRTEGKLREENIHLKTMLDEVNSDDDDAEPELTEIVEKIRRNDLNKEPYLITFEQFEDPDYDIFNKLSLYYYPEDDTLCDDAYEVLDQDEIVGSANLEAFQQGEYDQDRPYLYIRNESLLSDYEITCEGGSYTKEVLGLERR